MQKNNAATVAKKIKELPPLPLVVQRLLQVTRDEKSSANDVTKVLSTDQALASRVLKLVNSSFYSFPKKITTISRAVVIIGLAEVTNIALGLSAYEVLKKLKADIDWEGFWSHSISCAVGAQTLAERNKYPVPEEAFIAGLLHDIGHFVLIMTFPEEYKKVIDDPGSDIVSKEKEVLGIAHTDVGMQLLDHWQLPEKLTRVARQHHNAKLAAMGTEPLVTMAMVADILACAKGSPFVERTTGANIDELVTAANIPIQEYARVLRDMDRRVEEAKAFLNVGDAVPLRDRGTDEESEMARVLLVGKSESRMTWVRTLLEHFGYSVQVVRSVSELPSGESDAALVLLDSQSVPSDQLKTLEALSSDIGVPVAILGEAIGEPVSKGREKVKDHLSVPFVFVQEDIDLLVKGSG